jgi:hypothetical protein
MSLRSMILRSMSLRSMILRSMIRQMSQMSQICHRAQQY